MFGYYTKCACHHYCSRYSALVWRFTCTRSLLRRSNWWALYARGRSQFSPDEILLISSSSTLDMVCTVRPSQFGCRGQNKCFEDHHRFLVHTSFELMYDSFTHLRQHVMFRPCAVCYRSFATGFRFWVLPPPWLCTEALHSKYLCRSFHFSYNQVAFHSTVQPLLSHKCTVVKVFSPILMT